MEMKQIQWWNISKIIILDDFKEKQGTNIFYWNMEYISQNTSRDAKGKQ